MCRYDAGCFWYDKMACNDPKRLMNLVGRPESVTRSGLAKILHLLHSYSVQRRILALNTFYGET